MAQLIRNNTMCKLLEHSSSSKCLLEEMPDLFSIVLKKTQHLKFSHLRNVYVFLQLVHISNYICISIMWMCDIKIRWCRLPSYAIRLCDTSTYVQCATNAGGHCIK